MSILLIGVILCTVGAFCAYFAGHGIACGVLIALGAVFAYLAVAYEGWLFKKITALEESNKKLTKWKEGITE